MSIFRRILGIVAILIALSGIVISVGCANFSNQVLDDMSAQTLNVVNLARSNLETTSEALRLAKRTVTDVGDALDTVSESALTLSKTVSETNPLFDDLNNITTERVPDSLAAVEQTLPNIAEVAGTVDNTLAALSNFGFSQNIFGFTIEFDLGINYDPTVRFDDSIRNLESSLEGLPEQLRSMEPQLAAAQMNLETISNDITRLSSDITAINKNLEDIPAFLDAYIATLANVDAQLQEINIQIKAQLDTVKQGVLVLAIWFGLLQITPLYVGWQMLTMPTEQRKLDKIIDELQEMNVDLPPADENPSNS